MMGFGCDEAKTYPPYHILSVICIAYGTFFFSTLKPRVE